MFLFWNKLKTNSMLSILEQSIRNSQGHCAFISWSTRYPQWPGLFWQSRNHSLDVTNENNKNKTFLSSLNTSNLFGDPFVRVNIFKVNCTNRFLLGCCCSSHGSFPYWEYGWTLEKGSWLCHLAWQSAEKHLRCTSNTPMDLGPGAYQGLVLWW